MEAFLLKIFDWEKVPIKLIFVLFILSGLMTFLLPEYLNQLKLAKFIDKYGLYIGFTFIFSIAFLAVSFISYIIKNITEKRNEVKLKNHIEKEMKNLTYPEMYLLAFLLDSGKTTKNLPFLDDTVISLENKNIIYKSSGSGPVKDSGMYWAYTISKYAHPVIFESIKPLENLPQQKMEILKNHLIDWKY